MSRTLALALSLCLAGPALAGGHNLTPEQKVVAARNAQMNLYSYTLGIVGEMAQGKREFDADLAKSAAAYLATISGAPQSALWVAGTAQGEVEGSRALPAVWEKPDEFQGLLDMMAGGAAKLAAAAETGDLAAIQAAMGDAGAACGACHRAYRGRR